MPLSATTLPAEGKKPQVPPLRCAPVGMTILLCRRLPVPLTGAKGNSYNKIVIPTGAQRSGGTAVSFPRQEASLLIKAQIAICFVMTWQPAFLRSDSSPAFSTNYTAQPSSLPLIWTAMAENSPGCNPGVPLSNSEMYYSRFGAAQPRTRSWVILVVPTGLVLLAAYTQHSRAGLFSAVPAGLKPEPAILT